MNPCGPRKKSCLSVLPVQSESKVFSFHPNILSAAFHQTGFQLRFRLPSYSSRFPLSPSFWVNKMMICCQFSFQVFKLCPPLFLTLPSGPELFYKCSLLFSFRQRNQRHHLILYLSCFCTLSFLIFGTFFFTFFSL